VCLPWRKLVNSSQDLQNLTNKLNAVTTVLRLGHEAFEKENLFSVALHILNNTQILVKYDRACLVDLRSDKPVIIGVSGQSEVKHTSEYCLKMCKLLKPLKGIRQQTLIDKSLLESNNASVDCVKAFEYFSALKDNIIIMPLLRPESSDDNQGALFWVVEFFNEYDKNSLGILALLSQHYREAVWYFLKTSGGLISGFFKRKKHFTPIKVLLYLLVILLFVSFFRVSQNVAATFELVPSEETIEYAPYSGIISDANFRDGEHVKCESTILKYDTQELIYNLADAEALYNEISAEHDWVKQKSFVDKTELGKVKILALKQLKEKVEIQKIKWYLTKADVKAKISGTLILNDSEKWTGKAVRAGDKLFEIVSPRKLRAEVMLNEADASVICSNMTVTLYPHSSPETSIYGKIISISPKPMLTKTGQFCYIITLELNSIKPSYIVGMRGVARVSGERVSIGYYLFKNVVLWWRKI
jgi:multidrug resistance efflux pump